MNKKENEQRNPQGTGKGRLWGIIRFFFAASFVLLPQTALASGKAGGDPLVVVNNLSDFIKGYVAGDTDEKGEEAAA